MSVYRAKYLGIVTLKVLPTTCFSYNSGEIRSKFLIPQIKLDRIAMSFPVQVL